MVATLVVPAALYASLIWASSIASGWHYALDGMVGTLIAIAIIKWLQRQEVRRAAAISADPATPLPSPAIG